MRLADPFSLSYQIARNRFREAASALDARPEEFAIDSKGPGEEDLTIDVAHVGEARPGSAVVVSSGLHGIEGFFGSAIQLAWLTALKCGITLPKQSAIVLVHAMSPFGFAWLRRCDERM